MGGWWKIAHIGLAVFFLGYVPFLKLRCLIGVGAKTRLFFQRTHLKNREAQIAEDGAESFSLRRVVCEAQSVDGQVQHSRAVGAEIYNR